MARRRTVTELRPLREGDVPSLARWLPRAASELGCDIWASEEALRWAVAREGVLVVEEGGPLGLLAYEVGAPQPGAACIRLLIVEPTHRRLGVGSRAALALEERLAGSAERCYVSVPSRLGLAFYFWLRLGYQPLTQREWPAPSGEKPSVWMVRPLA